jgi:hypothetical protein
VRRAHRGETLHTGAVGAVLGSDQWVVVLPSGSYILLTDDQFAEHFVLVESEDQGASGGNGERMNGGVHTVYAIEPASVVIDRSNHTTL